MDSAAIVNEAFTAPRDPTHHWRTALERHRHGDADGAVTHYRQHLRAYPHDAEAWMNLGAALRGMHQPDAAMVCYQRALRLKPRDAGVWSNLGAMWAELGQHDRALRSHRRAVELEPWRLQLHLNHALALLTTARFVEAEQTLQAALDIDPDHPALRHALAITRLHQGRYIEAWTDFDARLRTGTETLPALQAPRWRGDQRIGGKRVVLLAESNGGETLWAARFIGMLHRRGADLTLVCPSALHSALRTVPARLMDSRDPYVLQQAFDFHSPLMSLPGVVDTRGLCIPTPHAIAASEEARQAMRSCIAPQGEAFRVGIVVNPDSTKTLSTSVTPALSRWLSLADIPGVKVFHLQASTAAGKLASAFANTPVIDLSPHLPDIGTVAAAMEHMDVIVAVDSLEAHLAGCIGMPTLLLLPLVPSWIYGTRGEATAWYPSMHLLRQRKVGDWDGVMRALWMRVAAYAASTERARRVW